MKENESATEMAIKDAVAIVLKAAPERPGGGGRKNKATDTTPTLADKDNDTTLE